MKKKDILKSKIIFNNIINNGKQNKNKYFVICREKNDLDRNLFGIAVGKKIGIAVKRNKIKRQIRNIVTNNFKVFPKSYNYIIIVKKEILDLSYNEMERYLISLIEKE